ncbi:hypothetical protein A2U01_0095862, partial [Trifolium medium]|nr:hypothetical protein [Trifolium medium]
MSDYKRSLNKSGMTPDVSQYPVLLG